MDPQYLQYRDITVGALLTRLAETIPDNEALVYSDRGLRWTFAELESEARLVARGLIACGVERGERVALWATNVPEWVTLQFALAKIGAILVTVNTSLRGAEIDYLLRQSESATVITIRGFRDVDYVGALREIGAVGDAKLPNLKRAIFIGRGEDDECPEGLTPYEKLREMAANVTEEQLDLREREVGVDDVINMQYTSGTTGFPKGVMLSSRNIVNNGYWLGLGLGYTSQDRLCLCRHYPDPARRHDRTPHPDRRRGLARDGSKDRRSGDPPGSRPEPARGVDRARL
jgi:fatty-acyl-CoA synthase